MKSEYDTKRSLNHIVKHVREGISKKLVSSKTQLAIWKFN